jgi:magnesium transporter
MLHATEILGAAAYDVQGNFVGRVKELFIEPADQPGRISRLLLSRGQYRPLVARHDQVASVTARNLKLTTDESALEPYQPNEAWLAVRKDLLDQQIIDTSGRKVVRVNDIDLTEVHTNGTTELRITQVDVGLTGAVGRLLQGLASPAMVRKIQAKLPSRMIPWEFVNLIEPDPMRRVKLRLSSEKLAKLHPADLADIMEELSPAERDSIIASLDKVAAADALAELDARLQSQIVEKLDPDRAADILEEMPPDEAADVLAGMSPEASREVLDEMVHKEAQEVRGLLLFEANTAGGMMNTEVVVVSEESTRREVVRYIREQEIPTEQLDNVILIDRQMIFAGEVSVTRLLLADEEQRMAELRAGSSPTLGTGAEENEVFEYFDKYNLHSLTVVDEDKRPLGVITVDDVVSRMHAKL